MADTSSVNLMEKPFYGWIIVIASFLALLIFSIPVYVYGVFLDYLVSDFGWSNASTSGVFSVFIILYSFGCIFSGRLSDSYGVRRVVGIGTVLIGGSFLASSQISSLLQLYLTFAVLGIGASSLYVPLISTIQRWFKERRGLATGIAVSAFGIGMAFLSPVTETLIIDYGWRSTFLIYGILSIVVLSFVLLIIRERPSDMGLSPYGDDNDSSCDPGDSVDSFELGEAVKMPFFWRIYIMLFLAQISAFMITVHIVPYAKGLGIGGVAASFALTFVGICNVLGRVVGGEASDRYGPFRVLGLFFTTQSVAILLLIGSESLLSIYPVAAMFGFSYGGWLVYPVLVGEFFGTAHSGSILGVLETFSGFGGAIGPVLAGFVYDYSGSYTMAFIFGALVAASAAILALVLREVSGGG